MVGIFDGSRIALYLNGRLSAASLVPVGSVLQQSTRPVMLGNHPTWAAFDGAIDEVRVYDTALTSTQVSLLADPAYGW